ncbi:MAG: tRNA-dihydrouridine synthase family protein [Candidatus Nanoarchaeia archaeon]|nr:tRNA-dihydrouridine synthase family protein [Candidatus Nanoarchaeia archaeon]
MNIKNKLFLAPMAGVNDIPFRLLCKKYGADVVMTEMISVNALSRNNQATLRLAETVKEEKPIGIQLFGTRLDAYKKSVELIENNFDFIDINFGCPATKVIKQGAGSALLKRPAKIKELVEFLVSNSKKPISGKIRTASNKEDSLKTASMLEEGGASFVIVHGRTTGQGYSGNVNYEHIKYIKENLQIPVVGNGDIKDKVSLEKMKSTNADAFMIGRAAIGNPMVFTEVKKGKETSLDKKIKVLYEYWDLSKKLNRQDFNKLKFLSLAVMKGFNQAARYREKLSLAKNFDEWDKVMSLLQM